MKLKVGLLSKRIPYARLGAGGKTMLILTGGPGTMIPSGPVSRMMTKPFETFAREYTIWFLGRRQGQPRGFSTRAMSDDCARLIESEFGGQVDAVIGMSYGGLIACYLASDHPDRFRRIVLLMAAHRVSDIGREIDYRYARLASEGKPRQAAVVMTGALVPKGIGASLMKGLGWLVGPLLSKGTHPSYRSDVMIEAEAEVAHDAQEVLPSISVAVLICVGTDDVYFPQAIVEETARLIERSELKQYEGRGHVSLMRDKRLIPDIQEFLSKD